jgi:nucleoside-diphosphate-sugar epimerase
MRRFSKITVIGGAGFVGTNFCQHLANQQIDFEIIDINPSQRFPDKFKYGDVRDVDSLRQSVQGDVVVNLAAVHRDDVRDPNAYYETNVTGAVNVAQICDEKHIRKIIFTSSVAVYGFSDATGDGVTDEKGAIKPFNEYGRSKYQAEEKLRSWRKGDDKELIIVRPTVIFGEGNRGNVYNLLSQIASGRFLMVGAGRNKKSMAYIGNIVSFLDNCLEAQEKYGLYNYVDTPDMDMNTLVQQVRKTLKGRDNVGLRLPYWLGVLLGYMADGVSRLTGRNLPVSAVRVKKFCASTAFASSKADLNDFQPPFDLQEGIARTLHSEFIAPDPEREIFYTE